MAIHGCLANKYWKHDFISSYLVITELRVVISIADCSQQCKSSVHYSFHLKVYRRLQQRSLVVYCNSIKAPQSPEITSLRLFRRAYHLSVLRVCSFSVLIPLGVKITDNSYRTNYWCENPSVRLDKTQFTHWWVNQYFYYTLHNSVVLVILSIIQLYLRVSNKTNVEISFWIIVEYKRMQQIYFSIQFKIIYT